MDINRIVRETFVVEVERRAELPSTNDRCAQRAKHGSSKLPLLVIADRQTAGRGRGGNRWWSGAGSLTFSLLLEPNVKESKSNDMLGQQLNCYPNEEQPNFRTNATPLISLAAGLSVLETVKPLLPNCELGIHWPNDVMAAGRKLAGILIEILSDGKTIVGIGINTNNSLVEAPKELQPTATTVLELTGSECDHTNILIGVLTRFQRHLAALKHNPTEVTAKVNEFCLQRNKPLTMCLGQQSVTGLCRGIGPDGAILLEISGLVQSFYSCSLITG